MRAGNQPIFAGNGRYGPCRLLSLSGIYRTEMGLLLVIQGGEKPSVFILWIIPIATLSAGIEKRVSNLKTSPNQGVKQAAQNALRWGSGSGLLFGLLIGFVASAKIGLITGLLGVLGFGLFFGGFDVVRHYLVRFVLFRKGRAPLKYAKFLDYAVDELQFMQRVGGGYIFIHRMLLEHFAEKDKGE